MKISDVLASPAVYQFYQELGGFFQARLKSMSAYLPIAPGSRLIDVGCGPGVMVKHLPPGVEYIGYEPDEKYCNYATTRFSSLGRFVHGFFDDAAIAREGKVDVITLNGVLHHMDNDQADELAQLAIRALKPGGRLFCFEPGLVDGQHPIARFLIERDRGQHVRAPHAYTDILSRRFPKVDMHLDHNLARVPYTIVSLVAHQP
jgi:SAM-dependent methyltransferase